MKFVDGRADNQPEAARTIIESERRPVPRTFFRPARKKTPNSGEQARAAEATDGWTA